MGEVRQKSGPHEMAVSDGRPRGDARGYVLVSLGSKRWTESAVRSIISAAVDDDVSLTWCLLDANEAYNRQLLDGSTASAAAASVRLRVVHIKSLLGRAGVRSGDIQLSSELARGTDFSVIQAKIAAAYREDNKFAGACRNQVFSNLQPVLRRRGVETNQDPLVEKLAGYLLTELAVKTYMLTGGQSAVEYSFLPPMVVWTAIERGAFASLSQVARSASLHRTVELGPAPQSGVRLERVSFQREPRSAGGGIGLVDVSLIADGLLALIGPSGAGKTTLLRVLAGHLTSEGRIFLGDMEISGLPTERRRVVTVFQDFGLFPHLTGLENVLEGARRLSALSNSEKVWAARHYLEMLNVGHCESRTPSKLSGGEQQRVAIARALMADPAMLLLDEPTAALDHLQKEGLRQILRDLRVSHPWLPIVLVTHDHAFALSIADSVAVMDEGRVLASASPSEMLTLPPSKRVAEIMGYHNIIPGECGADGTFTGANDFASIRFSCVASATRDHFALVPHSALTFDAASPSDGNAQGVLTETSDLGGAIRFVVRLASGADVVGLMRRETGAKQLAAGSFVTLNIRAADVALVNE